MKKAYLVPAFLVVCAIGFLIGRISVDASSARAGTGDGELGALTTKSRARSGDRSPAHAGSGAHARLRQEIRTASADQMAGLFYRALEIGDPVARQALMGELFARMDASNFQEMIAALNRVSLETGRGHHDEWLMAYLRAGQVAGQVAMDCFETPDSLNGQTAERTMWGWASADPEAALAWLNSRTDLPFWVSGKLRHALFSAASAYSPEKAIAMLDKLPEEARIDTLDSFTRGLFQSSGKDRAIEWLESVKATGVENPYTEEVARQVFDKTMWAGANQANASVMVNDLARLSTMMPLSEGWIMRAMGQIRDRKPSGGIDFLDQISRTPGLKDIPLTHAVWDAAVGPALQRDPAAVTAWLEANPDSPIHQTVAAYEGRGGEEE